MNEWINWLTKCLMVAGYLLPACLPSLYIQQQPLIGEHHLAHRQKERIATSLMTRTCQTFFEQQQQQYSTQKKEEWKQRTWAASAFLCLKDVAKRREKKITTKLDCALHWRCWETALLPILSIWWPYSYYVIIDRCALCSPREREQKSLFKKTFSTKLPLFCWYFFFFLFWGFQILILTRALSSFLSKRNFLIYTKWRRKPIAPYLCWLTVKKRFGLYVKRKET